MHAEIHAGIGLRARQRDTILVRARRVVGIVRTAATLKFWNPDRQRAAIRSQIGAEPEVGGLIGFPPAFGHVILPAWQMLTAP